MEEIGEASRSNIKNWAEEDRPREKLLLKGPSALSEVELIAILIRSGSARYNAVEAARSLMQAVGNDLNALARLSPAELSKQKSIGQAKAVSIVAALELGRRRKEQQAEPESKIISARQAFDLIKADLMDLPHEEFWAIFLNRRHQVLRKRKISAGGVTTMLVDVRVIFKFAMEELASGIIVAHNHPSGEVEPGEEDIELTERIKKAGQTLNVDLLDHIIVGAVGSYLSFKDEGIVL